MTLFEETFGHEPALTTSAHGRVNLIGEHTDYNDGFVLPTVIPQKTIVSLAPRSDDLINAVSQDGREAVRRFEYRIGSERSVDDWGDYLMGVTWLLRSTGHPIAGCDIAITSDVPMGSGLSSSAALEVALFRAFREVFTLTFDDIALAHLCQRVENDFVGARVGIMDPMACSLSDEDSALFLDTRSMDYRKIPIPHQAVELVVIHSGIVHRNVGGGYNQRRLECEEACKLLKVATLRDLSSSDTARINALPEPLNRRARHVVTENVRVLKAVEALTASDGKKLGALFYESHASMRDDYEVSIPEIDTMVELASKTPQVFGARLTGGGFGGSVVLAVEPGAGSSVASSLARRYAEATSERPVIVVPPSS